MINKINQIIEILKTLTLLEASELIKGIEKTFNIDSSLAHNESMRLSPSKSGEQIEEKSKYNVILKEIPANKKIAILKIIRASTGMGLKDAKVLIDSVPSTIQENVTKNIAEKTKQQIEEIGGKVSLN